MIYIYDSDLGSFFARDKMDWPQPGDYVLTTYNHSIVQVTHSANKLDWIYRRLTNDEAIERNLPTIKNPFCPENEEKG